MRVKLIVLEIKVKNQSIFNNNYFKIMSVWNCHQNSEKKVVLEGGVFVEKFRLTHFRRGGICRGGIHSETWWYFGIDCPPGPGVDLGCLRKTEKTKIQFFDSKSYSIDEISWTNTLRHPRHDQNMLETCFGPFKYDFRMVFEKYFLIFPYFWFSGVG